MGKGLGIALLIVAIIAIVIPLYGIYLGLITAILGIVVAAMKEPVFAVAIGVLNILDAVFLTPSLKLAHAGAELAHSSDATLFKVIFWLWVGSSLVSIIVAIFAGRNRAGETAAGAGA